MILKTRSGNVAVGQRAASLSDIIRATGGTPRSAAGLVTPREVAGLPAWRQAIRIASEAIAKHRMCVWRGEDEKRRRVTATWQARFFADRPNEWYSWFECWEATESSLTSRWNAFWLKLYDGSRVSAVYVLHPDQVTARWNRAERRPEYRVIGEDGQQSPWLTSYDVLHFRVGSIAPGSVIAPTPIEEHRRALGGAVAKAQAEEGYYTTGSMKTTAVVYDAEVTPEQAERWKQVYLSPGGVGDNGQVKVFGGGPKIETIGLSLADQQFVESQAFSIDDVGRILGVPPSLLWAASKEGSKPITPEHEEDRWTRYGLEPRRQRIEQTVDHDPSFFGPGARDYPAFHVRRVRGDALTESDMVVHEVQAGIRTPNEGRAELGLPPHPDGDILQITPVGGAPNETPAAPSRDEDDEDD